MYSDTHTHVRVCVFTYDRMLIVGLWAGLRAYVAALEHALLRHSAPAPGLFQLSSIRK